MQANGDVETSSGYESNRFSICVWFILVVEFCERLSYYSIAANLIIYCREIITNYSSEDASVIVLSFAGVSYILPLFGGWLCDTWFGKFNSIFIGTLLQFFGISSLIVASYNGREKDFLNPLEQKIYFGIALVFVSVGSGSIKSSISSFGVQQVSMYGERSVRKFFNAFYWIINIASLIAFSFIAYVQRLKYESNNFFYGFIPAAGSMLISIIIFFWGRGRYHCTPANGSRLTDIVHVVYHAISRKAKNRHRVQAELPFGATLNLLDYAHVSFGGKYSSEQVNMVRCFRDLCLFFLLMISFWVAYFQMPTTFLIQGQNMNRLVKDFQVPATSMNLFDIIAILLLIQLLNHCIYPFCRHFNFSISPLKRMGIGMLLAVLSMVAAGLTEMYRRKHDGNDSKLTSNVTVFLQIPQYVLMGCGEVFTSIAGLEFAYAQSPKFLHSVVMGLFLAASGIGAFIGAVLIVIIKRASKKRWFCKDMNRCHFEYYFFFLAGMVMLNFIIFTIVAVNCSWTDRTRHSGSTESLLDEANDGPQSNEPVMM